MSSEMTKEKVSRRLHQTGKHVLRQARIAKEKGIEVKQPHRLHKHHAMDCGNPGCALCSNPRKLFGERTIQERRFYQEEKGELAER